MYNPQMKINRNVLVVLLLALLSLVSAIYASSAPLALKHQMAVFYSPPLIYASGVDTGPGLITVGYGSDMFAAPVSGRLVAYNDHGRVLWTHTSPGSDYPMGVDVGNVDGDGDCEIAVGWRLIDHRGELLDCGGNLLWHYTQAAGTYVRVAEIGELEAAQVGREVLFAGSQGYLAILSKTGALIRSKKLCCTVQSAVIANIDGTGANEIVLASQGGTVDTLSNTGALLWSKAVGGDVIGIDAGQVTAAPGLEIAAASGRQEHHLTLLSSAGAIIWQIDHELSVWSAAIGDVNGDGVAEIVAGYGTHDVVLPGPNERGGVMVVSAAGTVLADYPLPSSVKMLAVTSDGRILASCDDGRMYVLRGGGWRHFVPLVRR